MTASPTIAADHADAAAAAASALTGGGVVILPTDTVYGLAALPTLQAATDLLFDLKGRGHDTPLAVLCADHHQALELVDAEARAALDAAAERWWPGPLTLVLPRRDGVQLHLGEPVSTIGIRVPDHPLVQAIARRIGPLAVTSANRHGEPTPASADGAAASLGAGVALVVDGGRLDASASTVVDATARPWRVLREGPIPASEIMAISRSGGHDEQ